MSNYNVQYTLQHDVAPDVSLQIIFFRLQLHLRKGVNWSSLRCLQAFLFSIILIYGSSSQVRPERSARNFLRSRWERLGPLRHQVMAGTHVLPPASETWDGTKHLLQSGPAEILIQYSRCPHTTLSSVI